jgi:hypothetical protein
LPVDLSGEANAKHQRRWSGTFEYGREELHAGYDACQWPFRFFKSEKDTVPRRPLQKDSFRKPPRTRRGRRAFLTEETCSISRDTASAKRPNVVTWHCRERAKSFRNTCAIFLNAAFPYESKSDGVASAHKSDEIDFGTSRVL